MRDFMKFPKTDDLFKANNKDLYDKIEGMPDPEAEWCFIHGYAVAFAEDIAMKYAPDNSEYGTDDGTIINCG